MVMNKIKMKHFLIVKEVLSALTIGKPIVGLGNIIPNGFRES